VLLWLRTLKSVTMKPLKVLVLNHGNLIVDSRVVITVVQQENAKLEHGH